MKRVLVLCASILTLLAYSTLAAEVHQIKSDSYFGCVDKDDYSRIVGYAVDGDSELFKSELSKLILVGQATIFEKDEQVYLEDTSIFSGMIQIRRVGEVTEYWTALEAID